MKELAVYIHVPFCKRKCAYCDFVSFPGCEAQWEAYFEALNKEIRANENALRDACIRSVFFGGGTPSLPDAKYISGVLDHLRNCASFNDDAELTLEANPGTLTPQKLEIYRASGINRLSIGVQSFDAELLKTLGRIHTPDEAILAVEDAASAGFGNISIDLMYALPGQTMQMWQDTLNTAVGLPLKHISAYSLIIEEGTPFGKMAEAGRLMSADDDTVNEQQRMANVLLARSGFERYEISNYARPGFESKHNITYWTGGDYLGLGCAAHSLVNGERYSNPRELDRYLRGDRRVDVQKLTAEDRRTEMLMLTTRMTRGLELHQWHEYFGENLEQTKAKEIAKLEKYGLIEIENGFLRLTPAGFELQDSVVLELL